MYTFSFIGTGSMDSALARAAVMTISPEKIFLSKRTAARANALAAELGCASGSVHEAAGGKYIFLGVKQQP